MHKDHIRDYATSAFRFYAAQGKPTYEQLKQQLYDDALEKSKKEIVRIKGITNPTQSAIQHAEIEVEKRKAELLDILAVERVMNALMYSPLGRTKAKVGEEHSIAKAVEIVYFTDPDKPLERGDISDRVHMAELSIPASSRHIYRWLRQARDLFAIERGLRL